VKLGAIFADDGRTDAKIRWQPVGRSYRTKAGRDFMKRMGISAALRRGFLAAALVTAAGTVSVEAGDRALLDLIGYSHDRHYLAFEEYGVNDGAETAFSNIYIVDLASGEFAGGSPFRTEADDDVQQPLAELRTKTADAAKAALADLKVDTPVDIDALSGDGVLGPASEMRFGLPVYGLEPATTEGDYTLSLETFDIPETACTGSVGAARQGFALKLSGDGPTRELHRDGTLPQWRECPVGYRLYAVVTPHEGDLSAGAAIVAAYPLGFEGPSRRFVVVPLRGKRP
jgi:predicted secreted protein